MKLFIFLIKLGSSCNTLCRLFFSLLTTHCNRFSKVVGCVISLMLPGILWFVYIIIWQCGQSALDSWAVSSCFFWCPKEEQNAHSLVSVGRLFPYRCLSVSFLHSAASQLQAGGEPCVVGPALAVCSWGRQLTSLCSMFLI